MKVCLDPLLERRRIAVGSLKDHVAACNKRFDPREADRREERAQVIHFHNAATDIDGTQQSYEARHSVVPFEWLTRTTHGDRVLGHCSPSLTQAPRIAPNR